MKNRNTVSRDKIHISNVNFLVSTRIFPYSRSFIQGSDHQASYQSSTFNLMRPICPRFDNPNHLKFPYKLCGVIVAVCQDDKSLFRYVVFVSYPFFLTQNTSDILYYFAEERRVPSGSSLSNNSTVAFSCICVLLPSFYCCCTEPQF